MKKNFAAKNRLSKDTSKVIEGGERKAINRMVLYYMPQETPRLTVVTSRKIGKSHERNKLKRWIREIFRNNKDMIKNFGLVFIMKNDASQYTFEEIREDVMSMMKKADLIKSVK